MFGCAGFVVPDSFCCTENFVPGFAFYLGFGKGISAVHLFACFCHIVEVAFDDLCPNPLLHFSEWDILIPICITLAFILLDWGLTDLHPGVQPFLQAALGFVAVPVLVLVVLGNWPIPSSIQRDCQTFYQPWTKEYLHEQGHLLRVGVIF